MDRRSADSSHVSGNVEYCDQRLPGVQRTPTHLGHCQRTPTIRVFRVRMPICIGGF